MQQMTRQMSRCKTSGNFRRFYIAKQEQVTIISYHYKQHILHHTMREHVNVSVIVAKLVTSHYGDEAYSAMQSKCLWISYRDCLIIKDDAIYCYFASTSCRSARNHLTLICDALQDIE